MACSSMLPSALAAYCLVTLLVKISEFSQRPQCFAPSGSFVKRSVVFKCQGQGFLEVLMEVLTTSSEKDVVKDSQRILQPI